MVLSLIVSPYFWKRLKNDDGVYSSLFAPHGLKKWIGYYFKELLTLALRNCSIVSVCTINDITIPRIVTELFLDRTTSSGGELNMSINYGVCEWKSIWIPQHLSKSTAQIDLIVSHNDLWQVDYTVLIVWLNSMLGTKPRPLGLIARIQDFFFFKYSSYLMI